MIKKFAAAFVSLLVAVTAGATMSAAPAQAAYNDCLNAYVCIWTSTNYGGSLYQWTEAYIQSQGDCLNLSGSANNNAESAANKAGPWNGVILYNGANCTQTGYGLARGAGTTALPADWKNSVSSIGKF